MKRLATLSTTSYELPPALTAQLLSPALVIYLDRVRANIQRMLQYVNGDVSRWRPHLKTAKIPEIFAEYADAGLRQFKCATPREAAVLFETLARRGVQQTDLLVAYPHRGPALQQLGELAAQYPQFRTSVICEDAEVLQSCPQTLGIFVDVNPGMNRTGLPLAEWNSIERLALAAGKRFRGLHFYDGHIHDTTAAVRRAHAHKLYAELLAAKKKLEAADIDVEELVTSGTPTFLYALEFPPFAALAPCRHTISPGTVVFHDMQYDELLEDLNLQPAALVFSRVVSHPAADIVTCDAGSKSLACEAGQPVAFALGHSELLAQGPSEEHLPFKVTAGPNPKRGTELLLVPRHVCPTVNLAESAVVIDADGQYKICNVAARAHDLLFPRPG